jgi:hypothetical protein
MAADVVGVMRLIDRRRVRPRTSRTRRDRLGDTRTMQVVSVQHHGSGRFGGVGSASHYFGGKGYPTLIVVMRGAAAVGPDGIAVGEGSAGALDATEEVEVRALTDQVEIFTLALNPAWPWQPWWPDDDYTTNL